MPAVITHHLFGEDAATRLPSSLLSSEEELLAFLLANQGPDPFFARFSTRPGVARACHGLARRMHAGHVVEALLAARSAAAHLPSYGKDVGRGFVLGLLGHYVLDSHTHPFVYAQQAALVAANPELIGYESGVHAILESDLDVWMLKSQRSLTVADIPTTEHLAHTHRTVNAGGAIFAQVASQVFGITMAVREYAAAVDDYRLIYGLIDPAEGRGSRALARIERIVRPYSHAAALAHSVDVSDECPAANLSCAPWRNPHTGAISNLSFGDLYFGALEAWPAFAEALVRGDERWLAELVADINYDGVPMSDG